MWITAHPFRVASWTGQIPKLSLLFSIFLTYKLTPVICAETWRYLSVWRRAVPSMWRVSREKASWPTQNKELYQQSRGLYILSWGGPPQQHGGKKYMSFTFTTSGGSRPSDKGGGGRRSSRPWDKGGRSPEKFFSHFGGKIRGSRAPREPPLVPPLTRRY